MIEKIFKYSFFALLLTLFGCREIPVKKDDLLADDVRLYQRTPAWTLAKAVDDQNINEINNNTKLIDNVYVSLQNIFEWPSNANSNSDGYCLGGNSHIGILSDGSVVICCLDGEGESNLGNIFYEDLSFILNSEKYHNIINYFKNNKCYLDICKKCTCKNRFK